MPQLSQLSEVYLSQFLWLAVALTLVTGAQYLLDGRKVSRAV